MGRFLFSDLLNGGYSAGYVGLGKIADTDRHCEGSRPVFIRGRGYGSAGICLGIYMYDTCNCNDTAVAKYSKYSQQKKVRVIR